MSEKAAAKKVSEKTAAGKASEKVVEKRRALGRGLASLLPLPGSLPHQAKSGPVGDAGPRPQVVTGSGGGRSPGAPMADGAGEETVSESASGSGRAGISAPRSMVLVDLQAAEGSGEGETAEFPPKQGLSRARSELAASELTSPDLTSRVGSEPRRAGTPVASDAVFGGVGAPSGARAGVPALHEAAAGAPHEVAGGGGVVWLALDLIDRNPHQTRMNFLIGMEELADSIRVQGVLQPIVVRPAAEGRFTLILGERRFRAAAMAGLETVPAIVKRVSEQQAAEMTLVENLQRQDLNCVDMASAFANLSKQFDMTQEEIAKRVGVSRATVANYMRLLGLPSGVLEALIGGRLTLSHAKVLMQLADNIQIWSFANKAIEEGMSVAKLEEWVTGVRSRTEHLDAKKVGGARWVDPNVKAAQRSLEEILGMRVRIRDRRGRGTILIEYATIDDFERVVRMLGGRS